MPLDFGFSADESNANITQQNVDENNIDSTKVQTEDDASKNDNGENGGGTSENGSGDDANKETTTNEFAIAPGTELEFDGQTYTVDEQGNILDANGNIFKEAKDVKAWKDSLEIQEVNEENAVNLKTIQDAVGIDVVDESGNVIEFEDTPDGIKSYVNQVIENSRDDIQSETINKLFETYPILNDVLNYYIANGNSLEGFNQTPNREDVVLNENNIEQQEVIIKTAWKEQGRKGNVDSYIDYLKQSGTLFNVAQEELEGLKEADKERKEAIRQEAARVEQEQKENTRQYWENVHNIVKTKQLGAYKLPDTIVRTVEGKKLGGSIEDFFNYIYQVDNDGKSRYVRDLEKDSQENRLQDELLRAYLKYTGGSYSNLVDMEINKKEVNRLKVISKETKGKSIRITATPKAKSDKIDFGF